DDCVVPEPLIKCEEGSTVLVDVVPAEMLWKVADSFCEEKTCAQVEGFAAGRVKELDTDGPCGRIECLLLLGAMDLDDISTAAGYVSSAPSESHRDEDMMGTD
ncbi:unnamed protein product, partial [Effrenium voratum]